MYISLLMLVTVLCLIFGHSYVKSLMDNVMGNRSLLSPLNTASFRSRAVMLLRSEGGNTPNVEGESSESTINHTLNVQFSNDRWQHQPSITSSEGGINIEDQSDDKQTNPLSLGNGRTRMNVDSNSQNLTRRENLKQLGLQLERAFWGSPMVRTDTVGTDNKYRGTKEHLLQALMDSIQANSTVASTSFAATTLPVGNVYSMAMQDPYKSNPIQSHGSVNEEREEEIGYKNSLSTASASYISDRPSMYAECNGSSNNARNNNNVVEKVIGATKDDHRNNNGET